MGNGASCNPPGECLQHHANLFLCLRQLGAPETELAAVVRQASQIPGCKVRWPDTGSVHLQFPGIRHHAFWEDVEVPWLVDVAARWVQIRGELDQYLLRRADKGSVAWDKQPES